MVRKVKPFIEKKKSYHFHLVHRSGGERPVNPEEGEDFNRNIVLQQILGPNGNEAFDFEDANLADLEDRHEYAEESEVGEAAKYGIFYDDREYDYMQHLRKIGEVPNSVFLSAPVILPSGSGKKSSLSQKAEPITLKEEEVVAATEVESEVETVELDAVPGGNILVNDVDLDEEDEALDPNVKEILEALEDDAYVINDGEEALQDDFVMMMDDSPEDFGTPDLDLNDEHRAIQVGKGEFSAAPKKAVSFNIANNNVRYMSEDDEEEDYGSCLDDDFSDERTNFSMSSSSLFRNDKLTLLDDQFDKVMEDYEDEEIGGLEEDEDALGCVASSYDRFDSIFDEFLNNNRIVGKKLTRSDGNSMTPMEILDDLRREFLLTNAECLSQSIWIQRMKAKLRGESFEEVTEEEEQTYDETFGSGLKDESESVLVEESGKKKKDWDCQSVLSTYSNLDNHPAIIKEERRKPLKIKLNKHGFPLVMTDAEKEVLEPVIEEDDDDEDLISEMSKVNLGEARPKSETPEEKRARKKLIKEQRQNRRAERKEFVKVFSEEVNKQKKKTLQKLDSQSVKIHYGK